MRREAYSEMWFRGAGLNKLVMRMAWMVAAEVGRSGEEDRGYQVLREGENVNGQDGSSSGGQAQEKRDPGT